MTAERETGPLAGYRVLEIGSIGPGPFAAMMLADLGADVVRVDRADGRAPLGPNQDPRHEFVHRGRRSLGLDLKHPAAAGLILELVSGADVLIEGFRPGVTERLGFGPEPCLERNPGLVYGRMTGWGQDGPLAREVGHDIDYIAVSGVLALVGRAGSAPTPPLNLLGDYGGGAMMLVTGILAALLERGRSGQGQVVDAAMVDGSALLALAPFGWRQTGDWSPERGTNLVDTGAPFYDTYPTADGTWIAVGALEPQFYAALIDLLGLDPAELGEQNDRTSWPAAKARIAAAVAARTRDDLLADPRAAEACLAPVLDLEEAAEHPHLRHRGTFEKRDGLLQPGPAPRFSRTPGRLDRPPPYPGEHSAAVLTDWGIPARDIETLVSDGTVLALDHPAASTQS